MGDDSPDASLQMSFETAEPAIAEHPSEHALQGGPDTRASTREPVEPAISRGAPDDVRGRAGAGVRVPGEAVGAARAEYEKLGWPARARGPSQFSAVPEIRRRLRLAAVFTRLGAERTAALRDVWLSLWGSRLLVWIAGSGVVALLGFGPVRDAFDPPGVTRGFGWLGDVLAAPAARWDAAWYLVIAHYGYRPEFGAFTAPRDAFFPLYPLGLRALSDVGLAPVIAGVGLSVAAFMAALYGLHRLTALEVARLRGGSSARAGGAPDKTGDAPRARGGTLGLGLVGRSPGGARLAKLDSREVARLAVLLTAFAPMAFYFSAVYSESLYLALSVGPVPVCPARALGDRGAARRAGFGNAQHRCGADPAVASALPVGPREDREPERAPTRCARALGCRLIRLAGPRLLAVRWVR